MDLYLTHEGDIGLSVTGDLQSTTGIGEILQSIAISMKTRLGQFRLRRDLGNSLGQLVGQFLTADTLSLGEKLIIQALSGNQLFSSVSIGVRGIPINDTQALFVISVTNSGGQYATYTIPFDFQHGILKPRTSPVPSVGSAPIS